MMPISVIYTRKKACIYQNNFTIADKSFIKPKSNTTQRNTTRQEGDVTINTNTNNNNRNNDQGEYVDFEEIKD